MSCVVLSCSASTARCESDDDEIVPGLCLRLTTNTRSRADVELCLLVEVPRLLSRACELMPGIDRVDDLPLVLLSRRAARC
eukprot:946765-Rhodomonas_salina.1